MSSVYDPLRIYKHKFCEKCKQDVDAHLVRNIITNGTSQVYWYCNFHKGNVKAAAYISHEKITTAGIDIDDLPVIENYSGQVLCIVCGSPGCEFHHFAPRAYFKDEADRWPVLPLCDRHHGQWHTLVTPGLTGKWD